MLVSITTGGRAELERVRSEYRAALRSVVDALPEAEPAALVGATDALGRLIDALQQDPDT